MTKAAAYEYMNVLIQVQSTCLNMTNVMLKTKGVKEDKTQQTNGQIGVLVEINGRKKNERYRNDKVKFEGANASGILILQEHGCNS